MEEPHGNGIPFKVWIWGMMGPMQFLGRWGADQILGSSPGPTATFALYTGATLASLVGKLYHFLCLSCVIFVFVTQEQGLRAGAVLPYLVCSPGGFHPRQGWCVFCGETPFLGDQKLLIFHGRWELWNAWSKGEGPEILQIKPCLWDEIPSVLPAPEYISPSIFIPRASLSSF